MSNQTSGRGGIESRVNKNLQREATDRCSCGHYKEKHQMLGAPTRCCEKDCSCKGFAAAAQPRK